MDNTIERQMIEDDFDGVDDLVPSELSRILNSAETFLESDIVLFSSPLLSLFCIFKRVVDAFCMDALEYPILADRYHRAIHRTGLTIIEELGGDHPYVGYLDQLKWSQQETNSHER